MSENRKAVRRKSGGGALVFTRNDNELVGEVLNLSNEGLLLKTDKFFGAPSFLWCRMQLPEKIKGLRNIEFDLEIRWCRKIEDEETYETGCQLMNVPNISKKVIKELAHIWMAKQSDQWNKSALSFKK